MRHARQASIPTVVDGVLIGVICRVPLILGYESIKSSVHIVCRMAFFS